LRSRAENGKATYRTFQPELPEIAQPEARPRRDACRARHVAFRETEHCDAARAGPLGPAPRNHLPAAARREAPGTAGTFSLPRTAVPGGMRSRGAGDRKRSDRMRLEWRDG